MRLDSTEEKISEFDNIVIETFQNSKENNIFKKHRRAIGQFQMTLYL